MKTRSCRRLRPATTGSAIRAAMSKPPASAKTREVVVAIATRSVAPSPASSPGSADVPPALPHPTLPRLRGRVGWGWRDACAPRGGVGSGEAMVAIGFSIRRAREQAARPQHQHREKCQMPGEDLPFGIDVGADGLGDADDHSAGERPPETPEPADDHRLERIEQARRPAGGIEGSAHAEAERANRD